MDTQLNLRLLGLLRQASYSVQASQNKYGQGRLLVLLRQYETLTQNQLIQMTGRKSATLTEQLNGMEACGYITREKHASDKRHVDVTLTEAGLKASEQAIHNRQAFADKLFEAIPAEDKEALSALLSELLESWGVPLLTEEYSIKE